MFSKGIPLTKLLEEQTLVLEKYPDAKLTQINDKSFYVSSLPSNKIDTLVSVTGIDFKGDKISNLQAAHYDKELRLKILDSKNLMMPMYSNIKVVLSKLSEHKPELYSELVKFVADIKD